MTVVDIFRPSVVAAGTHDPVAMLPSRGWLATFFFPRIRNDGREWRVYRSCRGCWPQRTNVIAEGEVLPDLFQVCADASTDERIPI